MSDGPGGSFDFGTAFEPERPKAPASGPAPSSPHAWDVAAAPPPPTRRLPAVPTRHRGSDQTPISEKPARRGQGLAWASLGAAIVSALCVGLGLYLALDSIVFLENNQLIRLDDAKDWANLVAAGVCVGLLAFAGAIVSLVRSRPRTVAVLALVAALVLPLIGLIWGGKIGLDGLIDHFGHSASAAVDGIENALDQSGLGDSTVAKVLLALVRLLAVLGS